MEEAGALAHGPGTAGGRGGRDRGVEQMRGGTFVVYNSRFLGGFEVTGGIGRRGVSGMSSLAERGV